MFNTIAHFSELSFEFDPCPCLTHSPPPRVHEYRFLKPPNPTAFTNILGPSVLLLTNRKCWCRNLFTMSSLRTCKFTSERKLNRWIEKERVRKVKFKLIELFDQVATRENSEAASCPIAEAANLMLGLTLSSTASGGEAGPSSYGPAGEVGFDSSYANFFFLKVFVYIKADRRCS